MSNYVRNIVIKKDFENDQVTIALRPITYVDFLALGTLLTEQRKAEVIAETMKLMPGYVEHLGGLKSHEGAELTSEELFGSAYFMDLVSRILEEWLRRSRPADPSKPAAPSPVSSAA